MRNQLVRLLLLLMIMVELINKNWPDFLMCVPCTIVAGYPFRSAHHPHLVAFNPGRVTPVRHELDHARNNEGVAYTNYQKTGERVRVTSRRLPSSLATNFHLYLNDILTMAA